MSAPEPIVFDGACVLCSAGARFVDGHDRQGRFRLVPMQSEEGEALFRRFGIDPTDPETVILVREGRALRDSEALLAVAAGLGWPWRLAGAARIVPRRIRDGAYRWIARNRYRLFGRKPVCLLPASDRQDPAP